MKDPNRDRFEERLAGLAKKSAPNSRVEKVVTDDGLIVDVVKPVRRVTFRYRSILIGVLLFVCLKSAIYAQLGKDEYLVRVKNLQSGNSLEVTAAFLLDADPVTQLIGSSFQRLLK